MKIFEIADLLYSPYVWIDDDLYATIDIPEDIGNKEVKFMYIRSGKEKNLDEYEYLAIATKK